MKFYSLQATKKEIEAISIVNDTLYWSLSENSPFHKDIKKVERFLERKREIFDTTELLNLCRNLMEADQLSLDAFNAIRKFVREKRHY